MRSKWLECLFLYTVDSLGALLQGVIHKPYLWRLMGENDPLFSSWKCSGFAMTPLQVRNDSKFDATGSQWLFKRASLLYLEYFLNKRRTETNIELSYCYNVL